MAHETKSPVIQVPDLRPKSTMGGYRLTWEEDDLVALVLLEPVNEQCSEDGYSLRYDCYPAARPDQK